MPDSILPPSYEPAASQPLIVQPQAERVLDDKEAEGAVYKSTIDQVIVNQSGGKYVSLSKEELEQYVNDPFWRRLRWICLLLFWFAWISLFIGAILIVITSPKCPPKPHRHWWEKKICYQIWVPSFKDSDGDGVGDFKGLADKLSSIDTSVRASAIWPTPVLRSTKGDGVSVIDFRSVDASLGSMHDFDNLVKTTHKSGMHLVMDVPLTVVSVDHEWFNKSVHKEGEYGLFFIWNDQPGKGRYLHSGRGAYYNTWNGKDDYALLNWEHEPVRKAMKEVLKFWLDKKVDGFYLGEVQYMALDDMGAPIWDKVHDRLKDLNVYMREKIDEGQILTFTSAAVNEPPQNVDLDEFKMNMKLNADVDYVISSELKKANASCGAHCFYEHLQKVIDFHHTQNTSWPMWEIGDPYVSRVASRVGSRAKSDMVLMLLMVLPGSVNVYYGDEIGMLDTDSVGVSTENKPRGAMQWTSESGYGATSAKTMKVPAHSDYETVNFKTQQTSDSTLKMYKRLASLRKSEDAFLYGGMELGPKNDDLLILLSSSNHSTTDYLTLLNFGDAQKSFNLIDAASSYYVNVTSKEASVVTTTPFRSTMKIYKDRQPIKLDNVTLASREGVVIRLKATK